MTRSIFHFPLAACTNRPCQPECGATAHRPFSFPSLHGFSRHLAPTLTNPAGHRLDWRGLSSWNLQLDLDRDQPRTQACSDSWTVGGAAHEHELGLHGGRTFLRSLRLHDDAAHVPIFCFLWVMKAAQAGRHQRYLVSKHTASSTRIRGGYPF